MRTKVALVSLAFALTRVLAAHAEEPAAVAPAAPPVAPPVAPPAPPVAAPAPVATPAPPVATPETPAATPETPVKTAEPRAAETTTPKQLAVTMPRMPPCAEPDADGPFLASTGCSGVFGVRGSMVTTHGVTASEGTGLMASGEGEEFVRRGLFSAHGMHRLAIGGGRAGFEGTLLGGIAGGFRIPVGDRHGPVFRAGAFGYLRGNDAFYASLLDFPQLQAGYQYLRGRTVFELGATTGAVLTGRFRAGDAETRILGAGLEVGAYGVVHIPWFRLGFNGMRLPSNDALSAPVLSAEGTLCAIATPFAICADVRGATTDAIATATAAAPPTRVTSVYGGVAFGFTRER